MTETLVISDRWRVPMTAQRREDGGIVIRTPGKDTLLLSQSELVRLMELVQPQLGRLERFPAPELARPNR
jgi:hypothetical protein